MRDLPLKLVFMDGAPHWHLPEGGFRKADVSDGKVLFPALQLKPAQSHALR